MFVTSHGVRADFASVIDATMKINEMARQTPTPFLLLDYGKVKFTLPNTYVFDLIRVYETRLTNSKNITMAVVFTNNAGKNFLNYGMNLVIKEGFDL